MTNRKSTYALGVAVALCAPYGAIADDNWTWQRTDDEAGSRIVAPKFGTTHERMRTVDSKPLRAGDLSPDRQFVFVSEGLGWQLRPMEYRFANGRLVHVDDPAGHMDRRADTRPLTQQERIARERSGGS